MHYDRSSLELADIHWVSPLSFSLAHSFCQTWLLASLHQYKQMTLTFFDFMIHATFTKSLLSVTH